MKISVQRVRTGVNMGDHAQDILTEHEVNEEEFRGLEALVERLLYDTSWTYDVPSKIAATRRPQPEWYLTIRVAEPAPSEENDD